MDVEGGARHGIGIGMDYGFVFSSLVQSIPTKKCGIDSTKLKDIVAHRVV